MQAAHHEALLACSRLDDDAGDDGGDVLRGWSSFVAPWKRREEQGDPSNLRNDSYMSA